MFSVPRPQWRDCGVVATPAALHPVAAVIKNDYDHSVKASELKRWLRQQGCKFVEESRHTRITLGSRISRMPRHPAKDIKKGTLESILKDLNLKM